MLKKTYRVEINHRIDYSSFIFYYVRSTVTVVVVEIGLEERRKPGTYERKTLLKLK